MTDRITPYDEGGSMTDSTRERKTVGYILVDGEERPIDEWTLKAFRSARAQGMREAAEWHDGRAILWEENAQDAELYGGYEEKKRASQYREYKASHEHHAQQLRTRADAIERGE